MTIGMLLESVAGKSGAINGSQPQGTPFQFEDGHPPVSYFGNFL